MLPAFPPLDSLGLYGLSCGEWSMLAFWVDKLMISVNLTSLLSIFSLADVRIVHCI
jgi:hypothetical protein